MKIIKLVWPILLIPMLFFSNACNKNESKCEGNVPGPDAIGFGFRLIDELTGESVIAAWGTEYNYEDVEFKQAKKDTVRGLEIVENGKIFFDLIDEITPDNRDDIVGVPFTNTYYLYLMPKNEDKEIDIDTIVVSSEVIPVDRTCISIDFGVTTIIYNDSIYHKGAYLRRIDFIKK